MPFRRLLAGENFNLDEAIGYGTIGALNDAEGCDEPLHGNDAVGRQMLIPDSNLGLVVTFVSVIRRQARLCFGIKLMQTEVPNESIDAHFYIHGDGVVRDCRFDELPAFQSYQQIARTRTWNPNMLGCNGKSRKMIRWIANVRITRDPSSDLARTTTGDVTTGAEIDNVWVSGKSRY
jgi:hypothetical protein